MRGALRITRWNWEHFKNSLDSLTKEPYKIGDKVVRCSECKLTFHMNYLDGETCPGCGKVFVPAVIHTGVVHLGYGRKISVRRVRKGSPARKRWDQVAVSRFAVRWLTKAGMLGVSFSVGLLIWAVMESGIGLEGFASWMGECVFPGAVFRLQLAAGKLTELYDRMLMAAGTAAEQLTPAVGVLEQVAETMGEAVEDLIFWLA